MSKVSFDFDSTLSRPDVAALARDLVFHELDVWVHTTRFEDRDNSDLWAMCEYAGIKRENVVFTNGKDKWEFLKDKDFVWHLDDDSVELQLIQKHTKVTAISSLAGGYWWKCMKMLFTKLKT